MTDSLHQAFRTGAELLARHNCKYTSLHKSHGISQEDWDLITQDDHWTPEESRAIRSILAQIIEVCMTIVAMPATPLPGQYAAAVIAIVVAPANRMVAALKCPETFDAVSAAGITEPFEVKPMRNEQLMALVMAYSGGYGGQPAMERLPREIHEYTKKELQK